MSTEVGKLHYDLNIDDKNLGRQLDAADRKVSGFGDKMAKVGRVMAAAFAVAGAAAVGFAVSSVKAFSEAQDAIAQTNAVLKSTGGVAGVTAKQVDDLSKSLQSETKYSDEAIRSAQNMLLTFTNISSKVFPETTQAVLDMSTAMGTDLKATSIQVGKALQDPILGVTSLQRVGVRMTESQKTMIESLVKSGKTAEAQRIILKELQTEFGGSAKAAGQTFSGALERLKNRLNDVQEGIGMLIVRGLEPVVGKIADFVAKIDWEGVTKRASEALRSLWVNYLQPFGTAIFNAGKAVAEYLMPHLKDLWRVIQEEVMPTLQRLWKEVIEPLLPVIGVALVVALGLLIDAFKGLLDIAMPVVNFFIDNKEFLAPIIAAFVALKVAMGLQAAFAAIKAGFVALQTVQIPAMITSLGTLNAALVGFGGWAVFLAAALVAFGMIMQSINQLKNELDAVNRATADLGESKGEYVKALGDKLRSGQIDRATYDDRLKKFNASMAEGQRAIDGFRATGGPVKAGLNYVVGERGKEVFTPKTDGYITPNDKLGGDVTVNIGTVQDRSDADYILRRLDRNQERVTMGLSPA